MMKPKPKPWDFNVGYLDTKLGIETFKPTDKFATFADWKTAMLKAADVCKCKEYANGVRYAFKMIIYKP